MKKNLQFGPVLNRALLTSYIGVMLCLMILVGGISRASASTYAATARLSLDLKNVPLQQVFTAIERQSEFIFFFSNNNIDKNKQVSIKVKGRLITDVLNDLFKSTNITYSILDRRIILSTNDKTTEVKTEGIPEPEQAKKITITGTVKDAAGQPVTGVIVTVPGTTKGVVTDANGNYSVQVVAKDKTLVFSFIGMRKQEVEIAGRTTIDVILESIATKLDEVVVVGYGTQKRTTITGSVSNVKGESLAKAPAVNVTNTLVGRLPGLVSVTNTGEPGNDASTLLIRGVNTLNDNTPLIVVDGIAGRTMDHINSADIESITILKDASAAIYGAQAANGVILVTTKRGSSGKPTVTMNYNTGFNAPTRIPQMADAATYATMMNEVNEYAGKPDAYTAAEIKKYKDGSDPLHYPNTNWFKAVFRDYAPQSSANVTINGGNDNLKYFLSLGEKEEDGIYKNSATKYNQYNFRSNIDGKVSKNINVSFDVAGREEIKNYPTRSAGEIFRFLMRGKPNMIASWPNGLPGPDIEYGDNPVVVATSATGYDREYIYVLESNLKVNINIPWVPGLSLTFNGSFDKNFDNHKVWQTPWTLYSWDGTTLDAKGQPVLTGAQRGFSAPQLDQKFDDRENITVNALLNYGIKLGDHDLKVMVASERSTKNEYYSEAFRQYFVSSAIDQMFAGGALNMNNDGNQYYSARLNYFGRVNYSFKERYLAEFVWRYDGSYIFPASKQFGFFPGVSLGWRISEEDFWKKNVSFINNFKLRASWGQTGNDRINEYQYLAAYGFNSSGYTYVFNNNVENKILSETQIPNPNVTWEIATQSNVGFEGSILGGKLTFEADYFHNVRSQILIYRNASVPNTSGLTLPRENLGKVQNNGVDGIIGYHDNIGALRYDVSVNGGFNHNKVLFWDETPGKPKYQQVTGHSVPTDVTNPDGNLYYQAIGIYQTQAQIDATPHWAGARTGDIIFKDVNGDGKIDGLDRVRDYRTNIPTFTGGFTLGLGYKQFDFSVLIQGAAGADKYISTESGEIGNYLQDFASQRWTPTNTTASYPRAFNRSNEYWVQYGNTFWLKSTDYIRVKNIEFGYTAPKSVDKYLGFQNIRFYFSGLNLFTVDKLKVFDPESNSGSGQIYPESKVVNVGVSLTF
jgi:TonB-linked SusC/RagA family outer membrane protein